MTTRAVELHAGQRPAGEQAAADGRVVAGRPDRGGTEFVAPCPCGNPDALWRCWRRQPTGEAGADYLGTELPAYRVECGACGPDPDAG